ncbi:MAG TPA: formate/nitrite transporter family protein [Longimicrobiales bacterium]
MDQPAPAQSGDTATEVEKKLAHERDKERQEAKDRKRAKELQAAGAHVIYEAIKLEGERELERPALALAFSGLAAGLAMGFSFAAEALLHTYLPDAEWSRLISKFGYAIGFVIVILGKQQLFTENTLTPIIPLLDKKSHITIGPVLRLWATVFAANIVGALLFAGIAAESVVFDPQVRESMHAIGLVAFHDGDFAAILLKGIFAGWLVALIVWLMPPAETAGLWVILILAYILGVAGFPHIIAGSVEVFYPMWEGALPLGRVLGNYMVPTLIGNVIGGVSIVAALNYAQVAAGDEEK